MGNTEIYEKVRAVPENAKKPIRGGRLNGKTDINPMWRIKALTETFGPCGFGWKYEITEKRILEGSDGNVAAFVDINLYVKWNGEWSEAIPGTGGSSFVEKERSGLYTSDECFKMALTDAISVSCKALGFGADVYWDADRTKYGDRPGNQDKPTRNEQQANSNVAICSCCKYPIKAVNHRGEIYSVKKIIETSIEKYGKQMCWTCCGKAKGTVDGNNNTEG